MVERGIRLIGLGTAILALAACGPGAPVRPVGTHELAPAGGAAASPAGGQAAATPGAGHGGPAGRPAPSSAAGNVAAQMGAGTGHATQVPFATPESPGGHVTVHTQSAGDFTETGSTCDAAHDVALFSFGSPGSGEEAEIAIHSGYTGPGTYSAPSADAYVSAAHDGHTWYAQFSSSSGATITVDPGGRSGSFAFTDQIGTKERVTGVFACG